MSAIEAAGFPGSGRLHAVVVKGASTILILVASVVVLGWLFHIPRVTEIVPGFASMKCNTALGFLCSGISLWCLCPNPPRPLRRKIGLAFAAAVALTALMTLAEYGYGRNFGFDEWLVIDTASHGPQSFPGRMSVATAICFAIFALALVFIDVELGLHQPSQYLALLGTLFALIALEGYLFDVQALYRFFIFSSVALHTAILFIILGLGLLSARPDRGVVAVVTADQFGGYLARRSLPWVVILPIAMAWLRLMGERAGYYDTEIGLALYATTNVLIFAAVIWLAARSLNRLHGELQDRNLTNTRLAAIVESSADAIIGKSLDSVVTSWNSGAQKVFGYSGDEMVGQSIKRLIPADRMSEEDEIISKIKRGEQVEHYETVRLRKDGQVIHVAVTVSPIRDARGRIVGASKMARDITERRKIEEQLRISHKEITDLKSALDEHAIVAITDPHGRITYVNDKFCEISQYSRQELIGRDHRIINSGHHPMEFIRGLWMTITHGDVWHGEIKNKAKDGSFYWVDTTIVPFRDEHGKLRQFVAIRADITARKAAEEAVQKQAAELARSNRDLEQFAYVASHDLQEPLRAVGGCLQVLKRRYQGQLDARADELIGHSVDGATRMQTLIEGLLSFSRVGTKGRNFQPVDCEEALEEALKNLTKSIKESDAVITRDSLPTLRGDPTQLVLLFQNLIGNAIKFRGEKAPRVHVGAARDERGLTVSIRDNGIGIDPQYSERVFVIFQRLHTRNEYPGTGIGLAICKKIMERHGGSIAVESSLGNGCTFHCRFAAGPDDNL